MLISHIFFFAVKDGKMASLFIFVLHLLMKSSVLCAFKKFSSEKLTWKEAKNFCVNQGSRLTDVTNNHGEEYWTGLYYAPSDWIHIIGCFEENHVEATSDGSYFMKRNPNIGVCQKICNQFDIFAVKSDKCLCLNDLPKNGGSSSSHKCTIQCIDTNKDVFLRDCGGVSHYNVYRTTRTAENYNNTDRCQVIKCAKSGGTFKGEYKIALCDIAYKKTCTELTASYKYTGSQEKTGWKESLQICKNSGAYLLGNININDAAGACQVINNTRPDPSWVGIIRQPVLVSGEDENEGNMNENAEVLQCQKCSNQRCIFTKECEDQALAVCKQKSGEEAMTEVSTQTSVERSSETSEMRSTYIPSNQSETDETETIITVSSIIIALLVLFLSLYCIVREIINRKKTHKALQPTRFNNTTYQQGDNITSGTDDETLKGLQTDHYTYVEPFEAVRKEGIGDQGVYNHLRDNEQRRDQISDVYDRACIHTDERAASSHWNVDHIYDQTCRDAHGITETESGLHGDNYYHTGNLLTESTYDKTKVDTAVQNEEYSHTQDIHSAHTYGKMEVDTGALDDEYCHTGDLETEHPY